MADEETKDYCVGVARILKERHTKPTKVGDTTCCLSTIDSVSPEPTEKMKPKNTNSKTKDTDLTEFGAKFCLPTMDSASPGPTEEKKPRNTDGKTKETDLTEFGAIFCLPTMDSVSPRPMEETKPRNTDGKTKDADLTEFGAIFCLPTMDSVCPRPKNDTKRRKVQLPITATHALGDQQGEQDHSMHASMGIFPVAHGQDTTIRRDGRRTWLMKLIDHYPRDQAATIPNAITPDDSLNRTTINMLRPMPTGVIQQTIRTASMPIMAGIAVGQTGTDHQDAQQKFRAVMNARRRAYISNMMTLLGRAPMPDGIRCFGE